MQKLGVSLSVHEPDELLSHASPENILRGEHRETLIQVEAHLVAELREDTCASAITFLLTYLHDLFNDLKVLHLWVPGVHFHQLGWNKFWPLTEELLIPIEAVVEGNLVSWL